MQSLPADSTGGGGHLHSTCLPFLSPCSPILPLPSISAYLLSPDAPFSPLTTSPPPTATQHPGSRLSRHLRRRLFVCLLFISNCFQAENTCRRHSFHFVKLSSSAVKHTHGLFVPLFVIVLELQTLFHTFSLLFFFFFVFFASSCLFPLTPVCELPPHQMFLNGGKQVKTPQQNAARASVSIISLYFGGNKGSRQRPLEVAAAKREVFCLFLFSSPSVPPSSLS